MIDGLPMYRRGFDGACSFAVDCSGMSDAINAFDEYGGSNCD